MHIVFIRAALIMEKYFRFSKPMCLIIYFHYGLNMWIEVLIILHEMSK